MDGALRDLAASYRQRYGQAVADKEALRALYDAQRREAIQAETNLLDAVSAAASLQGILLNDHIEWLQTKPQVKEAFNLAFRGVDPVERVNELNAVQPAERQFVGFVSNWKGKLFEVMARDGLLERKNVGGIRLSEGQTVKLAERLNQPGWDLVIENPDGSVAEEIQAKATKSLGYVKDALEKYPDISIVATSEVAEEAAAEGLTGVRDGGISVEEIEKSVTGPIEALDDSLLENMWEVAGPVVPGLVILVSEGRRYLTGRQTLRETLNRSVERGVKKAISMGVGAAVVALPGPNVLGFPAATLTRISMDRYWVQARIARKLRAAIDQITLAATVGAA